MGTNQNRHMVRYLESAITGAGFWECVDCGQTFDAWTPDAWTPDAWTPDSEPCPASQSLARRLSPGTVPVEPSESAVSRPQAAPVDIDGALRRLAELDAQRVAIRAERVRVIREMRTQVGPGRIAELLGISRQQVHKLLREP